MQDGKSDISAAHVGLLDATAPPIVNVALSPAPQALAARAAPPVIIFRIATIKALLLGIVEIEAAVVEIDVTPTSNRSQATKKKKV